MSIPNINQNHMLYALAGVCALDSASRVARSMSPRAYIQAKKCEGVVSACLAGATLGAWALTLSRSGVNSFLSFNHYSIQADAWVITFELCALAGLSLYSTYKLESFLSARWNAQFKKEFGEEGEFERKVKLSEFGLSVVDPTEDPEVGQLEKSFRAPKDIYLEKSAVLSQVICFAVLGLLGRMKPKFLFALEAVQLVGFLALSNVKYALTSLTLNLEDRGSITATVGTPIFPAVGNADCVGCFERPAAVKACKVHSICMSCLKNWMEVQTLDKIGKNMHSMAGSTKTFFPFPSAGDRLTEHTRNRIVESYSYDKTIEVDKESVPNCPTCRSADLIEVVVEGKTFYNRVPLNCTTKVTIAPEANTQS